jgi:hypothetical protein
MSDPHDMGNRPVPPSVSPLVRQATRNLHRLEVLTANHLWTDLFYRANFWRTQRMMAQTPDEAAAWLPALAFAVSRERNADVLAEFAQWPLPEPLPPEAIPWRDRLIQVWEQYPADTEWEKSIRLAALVRLDRRVERLPKWLREARRAPDLGWHDRHLRLGALAGWRPRPGDAPPYGGKRGTAQAWVRFWEERYRTPGSELDGLIAATALLHLAEAGWLPSGPSPERLREEFRQRVQQWTVSYHEGSVLRMLLASVPADASAPEQQQQDIMAWLELTHRNVQWEKRELVWGMLAAWQREGVLEHWGKDRGQLLNRGRLLKPFLLPDLARAVEWEWKGEVLRAMAGYIPGAAEVSAHPEAARAVVARWEALSRNDDWRIRQAAWVVRWNFLRAGVLTAEEQGRFGADDVEAIRSENDQDALLMLAQIPPPGPFPLGDWIRRLSDGNHGCRLAPRLAIHGWLVDMESSEWRVASSEQRVASRELPLATRHSPLAITRRQMRQALRRAGQEGAAGTVVPFVNLPREVQPDFRRLHEIETALAAGHLPPSPDTGAGNRPIPRTVPARLPETQPRMDPTSHTDRAAGADPLVRHPFPETIRHE